MAGDCLLPLSVLESSGLLAVLREAFPKDADDECTVAHLQMRKAAAAAWRRDILGRRS